MTWPMPERPKLPPPMTREERERERQRELEARDADPDSRLPRGVTRREDGSYETAAWRRDEVWMLGGAIFSIVLLVGFLAYWTDGFRGSSSSDTITRPRFVEHGQLSAVWWIVAILSVALVVGLLVGAIWALVRMMKNRGVRYDELPADEQDRRREVARLLKQVEPPVSREDAERQLGHVPPD